MIVIAGTITFDAANRAALEEGFEKMRAASLAETGCHEYQCYGSRSDPGTIFIFEKWADDAALAAHMKAPHMAEFGALMGKLGITGIDIKKYSGATEGPLG
jgi:quinol monooxygenase YgiN